jgi:hypothetical protein
MKESFMHIGCFASEMKLLVATGHRAGSARAVRIRNLFLVAIDCIVKPIIVALLSQLFQGKSEGVMRVLGVFSTYSGKY